MTEELLTAEILWTSAECSSYFRRSPDRFLTDIAALPDFPRAIRLPTGKSRQSRPLWEAREVIQFARKYKEAA